MSELLAFYFHDRDSPELVDCKKYSSEAWLCHESRSYYSKNTSDVLM